MSELTIVLTEIRTTQTKVDGLTSEVSDLRVEVAEVTAELKTKVKGLEKAVNGHFANHRDSKKQRLAVYGGVIVIMVAAIVLAWLGIG